jgi:hypothetical protein
VFFYLLDNPYKPMNASVVIGLLHQVAAGAFVQRQADPRRLVWASRSVLAISSAKLTTWALY